MKSILFTNNHIENMGGSELVTIELAEFYHSRGWDVHVYSPNFSVPMIDGITCHHKPPMFYKDFDVIWDHHNLLMPHLKRTDGQILIANHMSSYVEMEQPRYDPTVPHYIFCNSIETRRSLPLAHAIMSQILPNPAPRSFENANISNEGVVLSVSNHRPMELVRALSQLSIPVKHIGHPTENRRITAADFHHAKFVVCNGKTVQYALRAGVPVFLYDHFGGPGWLTTENFQRAAEYNFSGRGFVHTPDILDTLFLYDKFIEPIPQSFIPNDMRLELFLESRGII